MNKFTMLLSLLLLLSALLGSAACGEGGPGDSDPEICCACAQNNACGDSSFSYGACVPDGYAGHTSVGVDPQCIVSHCSVECAEASFK